MLALDVPSGLDSDTGTIVGDGDGAAVHATHTITFIGAKPGLFTAQGRDLAGAVTVAPIGVDSSQRTTVQLNAPELFAAFLPQRDFATNKGTFGSLAVVGGDTGMCGAPILASRAALFSGAGKVHVALLGDGAPPYDPPHPELMLHALGDLPLDRMDALAVGCGMGHRESATRVMHDVLQLDVPKLFDADALNLIAKDPALAAELTARGVQGDPCILTPHPLEAARLLGSDAPGVQRDRLGAARALAARFASVVVLKGTGTIIAAPDGRLAINPTGNAALATGGTGDVLGGIIGALLAQHLPRYEAALAGVYLHGLAADTLSAQGHGPAGLTAGELAPMVRTLLNRMFYPPAARVTHPSRNLCALKPNRYSLPRNAAILINCAARRIDRGWRRNFSGRLRRMAVRRSLTGAHARIRPRGIVLTASLHHPRQRFMRAPPFVPLG